MELIWDECWRSTINYGRKGLPIQALSALDLALWDALGKLRREPVYAMLGGKTKARLPTVRLHEINCQGLKSESHGSINNHDKQNA